MLLYDAPELYRQSALCQFYSQRYDPAEISGQGDDRLLNKEKVYCIQGHLFVVYGKREMMAEYICYGVLYIAEATIAWLYFDALFCRKSSGLKIGITFTVAYLLLFGITWFNSVVLNGAAFFLSNLLLLWMNYECKLRSAILHSAFLTSIMAITEIIAAWIISLFGFRFGAYADIGHHDRHGCDQ